MPKEEVKKMSAETSKKTMNDLVRISVSNKIRVWAAADGSKYTNTFTGAEVVGAGVCEGVAYDAKSVAANNTDGTALGA